jgi:hypothetical protein
MRRRVALCSIRRASLPCPSLPEHAHVKPDESATHKVLFGETSWAGRRAYEPDPGLACASDSIANQRRMPAPSAKRRVRRSREEPGVLAARRHRPGRDNSVAVPHFERERSLGRRENQRDDVVTRLEPLAFEKARRRRFRPRREILRNVDPSIALRVPDKIVGCQKALLALASDVAGRGEFAFQRRIGCPCDENHRRRAARFIELGNLRDVAGANRSASADAQCLRERRIDSGERCESARNFNARCADVWVEAAGRLDRAADALDLIAPNRFFDQSFAKRRRPYRKRRRPFSLWCRVIRRLRRILSHRRWRKC